MSHRHPLLQRQLKRLGIDPDRGPASLSEWYALLDRVDRAYLESDQEREVLSRVRNLSADEAQTLYAQLEEAQRIASLGNWSFDREDGRSLWSNECFRILGFPSDQAVPRYRELARRVHPDDRIQFKDRVDAAMHDGREFELEFRWCLDGGEVRWLRAIAQVTQNEQGRVTRLHGTVMDVTRRKWIELRQTMEHTVTRLLADADSPQEILPEVLQTVCESMSWGCGALWRMARHGSVFERVAVWAPPEPQFESFFRHLPSEIQSQSHATLLAAASLRKAPAWESAPRLDTPVVRNSGMEPLHPVFAFPILDGADVLGVAEFYCRQSPQVDPDTVRSAQFIGRHIGQALKRKQAEDALRESEAHFRSLVEQASDAFFVHDVDGRLIDVNQHGCSSLGYSRSELLAMNIAQIDLDLKISELPFLGQQMANGTPVALESRHQRKDGSVFPVEIRMGPIDIDGRRHLLSLVRDVTERKQLQDHIQHLAYHDALTDLPNRSMFNRHLNHAISNAQRYHKRLAVLFIDLDRFKNVNDTLGHDAGDRLLVEMARRLHTCLRGSDVVARLDVPGDMVARLGGDEFVVLIEEVNDVAQVGLVARKILSALVEEFPLDGQIIHITASIGVSMFPEDGRNEFLLMKHADIAMYRAKERGKNTFQFYSAQIDSHSANNLALESGLRRALDKREFMLYFQAKVETRTNRISGVEALVRWQHPELGLVSPVHFIPLAEESGLIVPLSDWVLEEAISQCKSWIRRGLPTLRIAVNLSARQFLDEDLLQDTLGLLRRHDFPPDLLELEITESMMMQNTERALLTLDALRGEGIRVAIDDFGIGYSSLSHLKQFPIDTIKIDRSFIKDIPGDKADAAITDAIIDIGKTLNIRVVAEGVETIEQLNFLRSRGCDEIQGYYFSRPLPAHEFIALLERNHLETGT